MKHTISRTTLSLLLGLSFFGATSRGDETAKENNTNALNLSTSWVGSIVPTPTDVALWNNTVAGANSSPLGGDLSWQGIRIADPGGAVTITFAAGNTLTLGSAGIDMSAATQNLSLTPSAAANVAIDANQIWNVTSGRTLTLFNISNSANQRLTGSGNIEITGGGTVRLLTGDAGSTTYAAGNGNDTYTGNWTITNGSVRGLRNGTHAWGQGTIFMNGGTIGQEQGNWTWANNITLNTSTISTFDDFNTSAGNRALKLQGVISGSGTINFNDTSNRMNADTGFILTGNNDLSGNVIVGASGNLRVGGVTGNDGSQAAGSGGTLGTATVNLSTATSTLTLSRNNTWTFGNDVSGSGVLNIGGGVSGAGTQVVTVSGTNTYTGGTTIGQGEMIISGSTNTGAGTVTVGSGSIGKLTIASTGSLTTTGNLVLGNGVFGNTFTVNNGGTVNVGSINNPWGTSYVIDGTVTASGAWSISTNAATSISGAGTIAAASFSTGNASTTVNFTNSGSISLTGNLTIASGSAGGGGAFNQSAGTINTTGLLLGDAFTGTRTYTLTGGRMNIGSGGIASTGAGASNRVVNLGAGTIGANGADWSSTLAMSLTNTVTGTTFDTLDSADSVTPRSIALSGNLTGMGSLVKASVGTLTLSGTNSYSGTTQVLLGTLLVNGSHSNAGSYTVGAGATLGGIGSTTGSVVVNGTFAPGASIESLATGDLTLNAGSTFDYELDSSSLHGDLAIVNGNLSLVGSPILDLSEESSGTLALGSKLTLINYSGTWDNGIFAGLADDSTFVYGTNTWLINYNDTAGGTNFGGEQTLANFVTMTTVAAIPEPSTMVLAGIAVLGAALMRLRRQLK